MITRLLPGKMEIWRRKKQKRIDKKAQEKKKKMEEWVSVSICNFQFLVF